MTSFDYTHTTGDVNSSLVEEVWFNENTGEAVVSLHGWAYKYDGVGYNDYIDLVSASSVGAAYTPFKRKFGPAETLGSTSRLLLDNVARAVVGTPQNWSLSSGAVINGVPASTTFNLAAEPVAPKGEQFAHSVTFDVVGGQSGKVYNTRAGSVNEAIENLTEVATMLDIEVKVKSVTVSFD